MSNTFKYLLLALSVIPLVFVVAAAWEFGLEGLTEQKWHSHPSAQTESRLEKWEYVFTATFSAAFALILPMALIVRSEKARHQAEDEIRRMAMTDPLTGLANRHRFHITIDDTMKMAKRLHRRFALLLVDLDHFKPVNDTHGHQVGDKALKEVAKRIITACREVDLVARLGGDEFGIIVPLIDTTHDAILPARRIIDLIGEPIGVNDAPITIGASIGISIYDTLQPSEDILIQQADKALYRAKQDGGNQFRLYGGDDDAA